ncbi:outer dynein arm-docking complex subunit 4-like [Anticarsia gemmatalis]|uniref:outer dynein arm-docking complex subunit 4-like n=1 Tax=Anticarsia gemmatalis TaxID=129554 RepID=UPI003F761369
MKRIRKKLEFEERPICNAVNVFRERGNYLQRLEQFEKAILSYNEALRWNSSDVRSLLGRSLARVKATHYAGALADAAQAAELEPENCKAMQIKALTEYEKSAFERSLVLAHRGQRLRRVPPDFAECARCAEETVRECAGKTASKVLATAVTLLSQVDMKRETIDENAPKSPTRLRRMEPQQALQVQEISLAEKQKAKQISRLMASKYLERMAHDKYFLTALCKDERLVSANKQGSQKLQELAHKALADIEKRQAVLRERRPMYAARASEAAARARLSAARQLQMKRTQQQHATDARRLIQTAQAFSEERDTTKCLEAAEFGMEQISRKPISLLPSKDKYLQELHDIVANAFLDQKRVRETMSESDRERRAFILLGMMVSREPSHDSVLRVRPPAPPRDAKIRVRNLERFLVTSMKRSERCYLLHELARIYVDTRKSMKARYYAHKCQVEAKAGNQRVWVLNGLFLLARCHLLQNNRPEARAALMEAAGLARTYGYSEVAEFYDTCVEVCLEGEIITTQDATVEKRRKDLVNLMQDDDLKSEALHLFKRMSLVPASRRFSVLPGSRVEDNVPASAARRRQSIIPTAARPTTIARRKTHPLGFQVFDL